MTTSDGGAVLTDVLEVAGRAPSVHNTQPWRFVAVSDGFELWAERSRQLRVLDPTGRQLVLSCGAALHHAVVGARAAGLDAAVEVLPDTSQPDLLARVRLAPGDAATTEDRALLTATEQRRTYRDRFTPQPVPDDVLEELSSAAVVGHVAIRYVRAAEDVAAVEVLLAHADAEQQRDPAYLAELRQWVQAPPESGYGIPTTSLDPAGGAGSSFALRHFEDLSAPVVEDPPIADHPVVAALVTEQDDPGDWFAAGQALSSLLLHASARGLAAQPLGQVTDTVAWRHRLAGALGVVGSPQLLLRLGHPQHDVPPTPRHQDSVSR